MYQTYEQKNVCGLWKKLDKNIIDLDDIVCPEYL